jgi:ketosteroid isomerase-like protein
MSWRSTIIAGSWLLATSLLAPAAARSQAADTAQIANGVLKAEDSRFEAMVLADTARLKTTMAEGLTYVHSSGRLETRTEYLTAVASGALQYQEFTVRKRYVHVLGPEAAAVAGLAHARATAGGRPIDVDVRYLAVYQRVAGQWRLLAWQTTWVT